MHATRDWWPLAKVLFIEIVNFNTLNGGGWQRTGKNREEQGRTGGNREEQGGNREGAAVAKFETRIPQSCRLQQFPDLSSPSSLLDQEIVLMLRDQLQNSAVEEQD